MPEGLRRFADHSSAFLTLNSGMRHYAGRAVEGLVAYHDGGRRHAFELCGPFAAPPDRRRLLVEFHDWLNAHGRRLTALQLSRAEAELFAREGFTVNQLGSTYSLDASAFHLRGARFMRVRNKISRARRQGVTVEEHPSRARADPELDVVDRAWLAGQGPRAREFRLMVGQRGGRGAPFRRIFVAREGGRVVAYATYSPVYGARPGWLYDLTRRLPSAPPGAVEAIFVGGLETLAAEGARWIHLGLTPFADIGAEHEVDSANRWLSRAIRSIGVRDWLYPTSTQRAFKLKWAPTVVEPEYIAFEGSPRLGAAWQLARACGVV